MSPTGIGAAVSRTLTKAMLCCLGMLMPLASGCSAIGYVIGVAVDAGRVKETEIDKSELKSMDDSKTVLVRFKDGTMYQGHLQGMRSVKPDWYMESYGEFLRSSRYGSVMPYIGDMVTVVHWDGSKTSGKFLGFGLDTNRYNHNQAVPITDALAKVKHHYLSLKHNGSSPKVYLPDVKMLVIHRGEIVKGSDLRNMAWMDEVPLLSCLAMSTAEGTVMFQLDQVDSVRTIEKPGGGSNAKSWGLGIGIAIDVIAVTAATVALVYAFSNFEFFPNGICITGCYNSIGYQNSPNLPG
jgi:hypothetical protein